MGEVEDVMNWQVMCFWIKVIKVGSGIFEMVFDVINVVEVECQVCDNGFIVLLVIWQGGLCFLVWSCCFLLLLFNQELFVLLVFGVVLVEVLEMLIEKESWLLVCNVLIQLLVWLCEGLFLLVVLGEYVNVFLLFYVVIVWVSECIGDFDEVLCCYIFYQMQFEVLCSKIVSVVIYLVLLLVVGGLVIVFLMVYVVFSFSYIYEDMGGDLFFMFCFFLVWGNFFCDYGMLFVVGVGVLIVVVVYVWCCFGMLVVLSVLFWCLLGMGNWLLVFQFICFYCIVGMLLCGGMVIVLLLEIVGDLFLFKLCLQFDWVIWCVWEGGVIFEVMDSNGLIIWVVLCMLWVGEWVGNMGEMMEWIVVFYDEQIVCDVEWFIWFFGLLLMLVIGGLIGVIVVFMYLLIFQFVESICQLGYELDC